MTAHIQVLIQSIGYVCLGALLLTCLIRQSLPRKLKIGAILVTSALFVAEFYWTQGLLGWSAPVAVPERFQILWVRVVQPDPARNKPGAVHLWLEAINDANVPSGKPRSYLLPYSEALAYRAKNAEAEIKKGHLQGGRAQFFNIGNRTDVTNPGMARINNGAPPGGDPSGGGLLDPSFMGGQSRTVDLVPLPPPDLPPKDEPTQE